MADNDVKALQNLVTQLAARVVELESALRAVQGELSDTKVPSYVRSDYQVDVKLSATAIRAVNSALQNSMPPLSESETILNAYASRESEIRRAVGELVSFKIHGEKAPFFTESYLYELIGKDDARSILSRVEGIQQALQPGANKLFDPRGDAFREVLKDIEVTARYYSGEANRAWKEVNEKKLNKLRSECPEILTYVRTSEASNAMETVLKDVKRLSKETRRAPKNDD